MTDIGMQGFNNTMDQFDSAMQGLNNMTNQFNGNMTGDQFYDL